MFTYVDIHTNNRRKGFAVVTSCDFFRSVLSTVVKEQKHLAEQSDSSQVHTKNEDWSSITWGWLSSGDRRMVTAYSNTQLSFSYSFTLTAPLDFSLSVPVSKSGVAD